MLEVGGRADKQKLTSRESANSFLVRRWKEFANEAAEKLELISVITGLLSDADPYYPAQCLYLIWLRILSKVAEQIHVDAECASFWIRPFICLCPEDLEF